MDNIEDILNVTLNSIFDIHRTVTNLKIDCPEREQAKFRLIPATSNKRRRDEGFRTPNLNRRLIVFNRSHHTRHTMAFYS